MSVNGHGLARDHTRQNFCTQRCGIQAFGAVSYVEVEVWPIIAAFIDNGFIVVTVFVEAFQHGAFVGNGTKHRKVIGSGATKTDSTTGVLGLGFEPSQ